MLKTAQSFIASREALPLSFRLGHLLIPPPQPVGPSNLVAFAPLTTNLPATEITAKIARLAKVEAIRRPLVLSLVTHGGSFALSEWLASPPHLNGEFVLGERVDSSRPDTDWLTATLGDGVEEITALDNLLRHAREHYAHVLVIVSAELKADILCRVLGLVDKAFLLLRQSPNQVYNYHLITKELDTLTSGRKPHLKPLLYLEEGESAHGFTELFYRTEAIDPPALYGRMTSDGVGSLQVLRDCTGSREIQLRGLAREIAGTRIGLALSSGGAKGLSHIGVIQVLEESGIDIDVVAGCSMGAYIAALWAHGHDGHLLEDLAGEVKGRWGFCKLLDPSFPPRQGFIFGSYVKHRLERTIGDSHFSDMVRPLRIVATNFDTLERAVFASGQVSSAVHASSAIPGVCVPVQIGDETFIDGGVADPLPVDVLREMGVERIIAVNTIPTPAYLRCVRDLEREQMQGVPKRFSLLQFINRHFNYFANGNILDNLMRSVHGAQIRVAEEACRQADVVIRPLSCDGKWHEFSKPGKYISLGRQAAQEQLDEIHKLGKEPYERTDTAQNRMAVAA
ncbi:MAG: Esterase [Verrucomicrobia bacterium]|nr:Esterase [Verrucomicrobiota bacterium]